MPLVKKALEFLQSSSGELSSKRLCFLFATVVFIVGTVVFTYVLIRKGRFSEAVEMWDCLQWFSCFLGGYVTTEVFSGRFKNIKSDNGTIS